MEKYDVFFLAGSLVRAGCLEKMKPQNSAKTGVMGAMSIHSIKGDCVLNHWNIKDSQQNVVTENSPEGEVKCSIVY